MLGKSSKFCIKHIKFTIFHLMHERNAQSIFDGSPFPHVQRKKSIGDGNLV